MSAWSMNQYGSVGVAMIVQETPSSDARKSQLKTKHTCFYKFLDITLHKKGLFQTIFNSELSVSSLFSFHVELN